MAQKANVTKEPMDHRQRVCPNFQAADMHGWMTKC